MNPNPFNRLFLTVLLLLGAQAFLRADVTNSPAVHTNATAILTNKPTNAERRARIEAWRQEHSGVFIPPPPAEDTRHMPLEERRARVKAHLAEVEHSKDVTNQAVFNVTTNPAAPKSIPPKP